MELKIRNVAIIAHVDHGKTTLVDALLRQSEAMHIKAEQTTLIMDSNELERERGITIFSKNAAVHYKGYKINIIDTPGHADFGGEVERIMGMASGVLLLVDAKDGPMPQTKFVLKKALEQGQRVIVVINKIDVPEARVDWVLEQTFGLFVDLGATDEQANFPVLYASAIQGKAGLKPELASMENIAPVFEAIIKELPAPVIQQGALQMLVVSVAYDDYLGQIAIGPVVRGEMQKGQGVKRMARSGEQITGKVAALFTFEGLGRQEVEKASAGEIVAVAGVEPIKIGETIAAAEQPEALPVLMIDEPTVKMSVGINTSPLSGKEGKFSTSRQLKERLEREVLADVALRVEPASTSDSAWMVLGRGELHLSILMEKMRREGYELQVGKPEVIFREEKGQRQEPFEDVEIECPEEFAGIVIEKMGQRRGEMQDMKIERQVAKLKFLVSTRGLIGYRAEFLTDTRGEGIINTLFAGYMPTVGAMEVKPHGSLIAHEAGVSTHYGLVTAQERGLLFIKPGVKVYEGMVVGKNARADDIDVNVCREKKLTNMRSSTSEVSESLQAAKNLSLEEAIEYLGDDELLEITPENLRLRKKYLKKGERKRGKNKVD
jgi:GTP-binding protein